MSFWKKARISVLAGIFSLTLIVGSGAVHPGHAAAQNATFYTWPSTPTGTVGVTKPAIQMKIRYDGLQVTSYSMTLNGSPVPASYDAATERFSYTPASALKPGSYSVKFIIQFKGFAAKQYSWNFTVASSAVTDAPPINAEQRQALQAVNDIRREMGLGQVTFNANLNLAAQAHARYQDLLGTITHDEVPGTAGYTGQTITQRIAYFGYVNDSESEDISQQYNAAPTEAIDGLFDAPYHRTPFLDPGLTEIGYAKEGNFHVLLFGQKESRNASPVLVTSPGAGSNGVPAGWNGHEIPDPLRLHGGAKYPVGYPIMVGGYGAGVKQITITDAELKDTSGQSVPLLSNNPGSDDHLTNQAFLIPAKPLKANTRYQVNATIRILNDDGTSTSERKTWSYTTEASEGAGWKEVHKIVSGDNGKPGGATPSHSIAFGLDQTNYTLDGVNIPMTVKPLIIDGFSYLAIRDLEKALGATVEWDDTRKAAIYKKDDRTVIFFTNRNAYELNGSTSNTNTPAKLVNANTDNPRTMIPVRLLSNLLGCSVDYIDATRTVKITY